MQLAHQDTCASFNRIMLELTHHHLGSVHRFGRNILIGLIIGLIVGVSWGWSTSREFIWFGNWLYDGLTFGIIMGICSFVLSWLLAVYPSATASVRDAQRRSFLVHFIQTIHGQRACS